MYIRFTEEAASRIRDRLQQDGGAGVVRLVYDTEGCGCAVSGVPALWLTDRAGDDDMAVDSSDFHVTADRNHAVFFEERLAVDFKPTTRSFILKSDRQIYSSAMRLADMRNSS